MHAVLDRQARIELNPQPAHDAVSQRSGLKEEEKSHQHGWQGDTQMVAPFALPTFAAFIIGFLVPFIMGVYFKLCEFTTVADGEWVGLRTMAKR